MGMESSQQKLSRIRPPRVQITYDVEVGGAIESKELPMVLGVVGDLSGHATHHLPRLKDRRFVQIDRDNINEVIKAIAPGLSLSVPNRLGKGDDQLGIELTFTSMDDFEPDQLVRQIEPLNKLLDIRSRLSDLRNKMVGNDRLEEALDQLVRDTNTLTRLGTQSAGNPNVQPDNEE